MWRRQRGEGGAGSRGRGRRGECHQVKTVTKPLSGTKDTSSTPHHAKSSLVPSPPLSDLLQGRLAGWGGWCACCVVSLSCITIL
ncbi:hypothetical protein E2C01_090087 [Portunus trituberculatus]|uniref:Uncharacterized protein n=1 Tax=Portunus trituberculatus TaxID=210409 RepID=A0A5B7JP58_PORTR|nr:hypothetical protein [Portunus trituberculatus]